MYNGLYVAMLLPSGDGLVSNVNHFSYVPDHRHSFEHGETTILPIETILGILERDLRRRNCILIGHNIQQDLEFLVQYGMNPRDFVERTYDTSRLYQAKKGNRQIGVKEMCKTLSIPTRFLHNAVSPVLHHCSNSASSLCSRPQGNDAFYTMLAFLALTD